MATVVLFHHVLGRTAGLVAVADALRGRGHEVLVPDLFEGRRFDSIEDGVAFASAVGFGEIVERGVVAAAGRDRFVVVGVSLGVLPAQRLAQTDPRVTGAFLIDSAIPLGEFADSWPPAVPLEVHLVDGDELAAEDRDAADAIVAAAGDGRLVEHPGEGHLVVDASAPAHDPPVARAIVAALIAFVDRCDDAGGSGVV